MGIWTNSEDEAQLVIMSSEHMVMADRITMAITDVANSDGHYYGKLPVILARSIQNEDDDDAITVHMALTGDTLMMLLSAISSNMKEFAEQGWIPVPPEEFPE